MRKILVFALCCITHGLFAQWQTIYNDIYNTNYGNVGIRTVYPQTALNIYFGPGDDNDRNWRLQGWRFGKLSKP